jgi:hypothetical protein
MSRQRIEPMDREMAALLAFKKVVPAPPADAEARVLARVVGSIGVPSRGDSDSGGRGSSASQGGAAPAKPSIGAARLIATHPLPSMLGTFALGVMVGVVARGVTDRRESGKNVGRTVTEVASAISETANASSAAPPSSAATPPQTQSHTANRTPVLEPNGKTLAAERTLLDVARAALSRGEAASAVEAAQRHAAEFPSGQLAEEREAILIRALIQAGDVDDARARAARFHVRYPASIFGRAIDSAIASIP